MVKLKKWLTCMLILLLWMMTACTEPDLPEMTAALTGLAFTKEDNSWLIWDVTCSFDGKNSLITTVGHPNLIGQTVIPAVVHTGKSVHFNGISLAEGSAVTLRETNTLTLTDENGADADYTVRITDTDSGIPTVIINTNDRPIESKSTYVDARISVIGTGNWDIIDAKAEIRLRGNTTMEANKKPYRIKFEEKQNVLGIASAKSWVLLANYLDPSYMRGQLAFGLASRINENTAQKTGYPVFAPRMKTAEIYLNGEYIGLYDLGDHVQADDTRVAIDESGDKGDTAADVGYFIEVEVMQRVLEEGAEGHADRTDYSMIENVGARSMVQNNMLYFQFKLPEAPSAEQKSYITAYMQKVSDMILAHDKTVLEYIDLSSFIDWYLVNELFKNSDSAMQSSVYFFKDKGGKLYMGPVWDFDLSAGSLTRASLASPEDWRTLQDEYCGWFKELFSEKMFADELAARWYELRREGIIDSLFSEMDRLEQQLRTAAERDWAMWHEDYLAYAEDSWLRIPETAKTGDWLAQVDALRQFLLDRSAWLDAYFDPISYINDMLLTADAGRFVSDEALTRAMFVEILWQAVGCPKASCVLPFTDVPSGADYTDALQWAVFSGIIYGTSETTFEPDEKLTREQLSTILYRLARQKAEDKQF